jgi:endonuclease/exonuclease/phosphatase family metal-dependent hydrolase
MRRFRRIVLWTFAIVGVVFAYRILVIYEFRSGECNARKAHPFERTYPKRLVVMTYNIEGHAALLRNDHIEEIAETILRHKPDVVAINEAHRGTWQARFGDHVQQLHRLTQLNAAFGRSYRFLGGEFGNAVLTRGKVVRSEVHELPGTGEPRTLFETVINLDGGTFELYVTHLAAWASVNRTARRIQLQCVHDHVLASAHPFILAGDINAPPDAPEVREFLNTNVVKGVLSQPTPTHRVMEQQLDHILVDGGWTVKSARVLDDGPSDHRPVIAELTHP